jgi:hypothetical protein
LRDNFKEIEPSMTPVRTFTSESFKTTLQDNMQLMVPGSKILTIEEAPIKDCYQAEWGMACNANLERVIGTLFRGSIGEGQGNVNFGTLGILGLGVFPEERKWGIVSSEPIYISLNNQITYPIEIKDIFKKMIYGMMPRTIVIRSNEKLLIKDLRINIENKPDGTPTDQSFRSFITTIFAIFESVVNSFSQEEIHMLRRQGMFDPYLMLGGAKLSMIRQVFEGTLVSFSNNYILKVLSRS